MKPLRKTLGFVIMKRKIYDKLLQWKREKNGATALMIEGARRVGKSYIAREFARNEYDSFILIDFSKAPQRVRGWFDEYLEDIDTLLQNIQLHYKKKLATRKSLIIFDEVQKCPKAREAIKALVEDGRFDYLETGSLISIKKNVENIVIPSEEDGIDMYPMDFEEFLWAMGNEVLMPYIRKQFEKCKPMGDFHREALHYFRQYLIVGGMPQAVAEYAASRDFTKVDAIKRQILRLYKNDIKKYAGGLTARVSAIYDAIPGQLQKKEKQFTLTALKDEARMREYDSAFFWLDDAKLANICYNTTAPNIGLQLNEDRTTLKCYFCDTGLLISLAFSARGIVTNEIYQKLMFDKLEIDEGMLVENIVAQMLKTAGSKLFFYNNYDKEEAENRMQIDFLIQKEVVTSRHNISPIEVKSSTNYTLTSIKKCIKKYGQYLSTPYVLHTNDVEQKDGLTYLPLYMTPFYKTDIRQINRLLSMNSFCKRRDLRKASSIVCFCLNADSLLAVACCSFIDGIIFIIFAHADLGAETAAQIQGTHYDINGEMDMSQKNKDGIYYGLKMNVSPTFSITVYFKE